MLGFDIEVGLKRADGSLRRYTLSVLPMRLHAFLRNELHIVRNDLDNARQRAAYRLAWASRSSTSLTRRSLMR